MGDVPQRVGNGRRPWGKHHLEAHRSILAQCEKGREVSTDKHRSLTFTLASQFSPPWLLWDKVEECSEWLQSLLGSLWHWWVYHSCHKEAPDQTRKDSGTAQPPLTNMPLCLQTLMDFSCGNYPLGRRDTSISRVVLLASLGSRGQTEIDGPGQHLPGMEILDVHISVWSRLPLTPQQQTFFGRCFCNDIKKRCLEGKTLREQIFYIGHTKKII